MFHSRFSFGLLRFFFSRFILLALCFTSKLFFVILADLILSSLFDFLRHFRVGMYLKRLSQPFPILASMNE